MINYAPPAAPRRPAGQVLVWLMPLWCLAIVVTPHALGVSDDPFWFAAMILPLVVAMGCAARREWGRALYSAAIALLVFAVGVTLPSLNHAR